MNMAAAPATLAAIIEESVVPPAFSINAPVHPKKVKKAIILLEETTEKSPSREAPVSRPSADTSKSASMSNPINPKTNWMTNRMLDTIARAQKTCWIPSKVLHQLPNVSSNMAFFLGSKRELMKN